MGRVLEIGVGSGINLPLYTSDVHSVAALDISPQLLAAARDNAKKARVSVYLLEATGEDIPFADHSFDTVVTTWTLCTISDVSRALLEIRRVLRPTGSLLFVEHGRAPELRVARWQDRLDPLWSRLAGGCHLNRSIDRIILGAGFHLQLLQHSRVPGPRTHTFLYEGCATPAYRNSDMQKILGQSSEGRAER
jgi:SAM-dependent methyltransferase